MLLLFLVLRMYPSEPEPGTSVKTVLAILEGIAMAWLINAAWP